MLVTICLHGLSFAISEKGCFTNFSHGLNSIEENIVKCNTNVEFEIIFHTWNHEHINDLINLINDICKRNSNCIYDTCITYEVDNRLTFETESEDILNESLFVSKNESTSYKTKDKLQSILSKNYSSMKVLELINNQSDWVILTRFDNIFITNLDLTNTFENKHLEIYLADWNYDYDALNKDRKYKSECDGYAIDNIDLNKVMSKGFVDYYILIGKKNVKPFSVLFNSLKEYLKNGSEYEINCIDMPNDVINNERQKWPQKLSGHPLLYWHLMCILNHDKNKIGYINHIIKDIELERNIINHAEKVNSIFNEKGYETALHYYDSQIDILTKRYDFGLHLNMCAMCFKSKHYEKALYHSWNSIIIHKSSIGLKNIAVIYETFGKTLEAMYFYQELLKLYPETSDAEVIKKKLITFKRSFC